MKTIIVNHKKILVEDNTPLKEVLSNLGYVFPCNGQGKCGKCRIVASELSITDLDKRFLNDTQLSSGMRLSCDKIVSDNLDINCLMQQSDAPAPKKLTDCRIAVSIGTQYIDIGILDNELVEVVTVPNPLSEYGGITEIANSYKEEKVKLSNALRAVIGKNSIELMEKYSAAKAETLAIASSGLYLNILLNINLDCEVDYDTITENDNLSLPAQNIYILPVLNCYVGGDIFAQLIDLPENSLLIDCENILTFAGIGKDNNYISSMWDIDINSDMGKRCFKAALDFMCYKLDNSPSVYIYGDYTEEIEDIIIDKNLTFFTKIKTVDNVAKACLYHRTRTKLNKEKNRSTVIKLLEDDKFQEFLTY